jgi:hypothetical protein
MKNIMNNGQKNSAGILVLNLIYYTGEYANVVEGSQYLFPFSGHNSAKVEGIVQLFNDKYGGGSEYDLTRASIIEASSVREAVYACEVTESLNYSYVKIHSFKSAFNSNLLKHLQTIFEIADIDNLENKLSSLWRSTPSS